MHNIQYSYVTLCQPINLLSASTRQGPGQSVRHTHTLSHIHTTDSYLVTHIKLHHLLFVSRGIRVRCVMSQLLLLQSPRSVGVVCGALATLVRCTMSRDANCRAFYRLTLSNLINLSQLTKNHKNLCKSKRELYHRRCNACSSQQPRPCPPKH